MESNVQGSELGITNKDCDSPAIIMEMCPYGTTTPTKKHNYHSQISMMHRTLQIRHNLQQVTNDELPEKTQRVKSMDVKKPATCTIANTIALNVTFKGGMTHLQVLTLLGHAVALPLWKPSPCGASCSRQRHTDDRTRSQCHPGSRNSSSRTHMACIFPSHGLLSQQSAVWAYLAQQALPE